MKFDYIIGNPPYQDSTSTNNRDSAVYPYFYDAAKKLAHSYELISPARFLFNTGLTSKDWNKKMLTDPHIDVTYYEADSSKVFSQTDIKGGVAIVYRDDKKEFGQIGTFIPNEKLRSISKHFNRSKKGFASIVFSGRSDMKFTDEFIQDFPQSVTDRIASINEKSKVKVNKLSPNEEYELKSSTFAVLPYAFLEKEPENSEQYYKILGLNKGKREYRWISKKYLIPRYPEKNNINWYKVLLPESNGAGKLGETLSTPLIAYPGESSTPTFISIGQFETEQEAENALKYIKTKLVRALLAICKKTQHNPASVWLYVPLQDFTSNSDIDWSKSIPEIDQQLYKKYGLDDDEIKFIETHVKEMN